MTEHKKIMINESFFNTTSNGGNKTKKNKGNGRPKKEKPKPVLKPNSLKKTLLDKIKKHQQNEKMTKQNVDQSGSSNKQNDNNDKFTDDFMNSMEYLSKLGDKNKNLNRENKKRNKSQKRPQLGGTGQNIPPTMILPPYVKNSELVSIELPTDFDTSYTITNSQVDRQRVPINYQQYTNNIPINVGEMSQVSHLPLDQPPQQIPTTMPQQIPTTMPQQIPTTIPQQMSTPYTPKPHMTLIGGNTDTPYGCLKGGQKPTYREYHNKTMKNTHKPIIVTNVPKQVTDRQHQLAKLKKSYKKIRQKKRTTKKSTYTLGKHGGSVSVLIKNNATRRKVRREHGLLKQKSINEVKKHLYDKNLLKIGSAAPNDVLRTLYEQSILAGDITNISSDIQFHNFMNNT
jgi:hypothetical protein